MTGNKAFKVARIQAGFLQRDLAVRVGLPEHAITRIETGRWGPPPEIKKKLSEILGKPTCELFTEEATR